MSAVPVGLALLAVLETLGPAQRLAFVLHDMFGVPFDEIAPIMGPSPISRASENWSTAFLTAARDGDFGALVAVLDPDVVLRADRGAVPPGASTVIRSARIVAQQALMFSKLAAFARAALINGAAGIVGFDTHGRPFAIMGFTVALGKIVEIDILADPARLRQLDLTVLDDQR